MNILSLCEGKNVISIVQKYFLQHFCIYIYWLLNESTLRIGKLHKKILIPDKHWSYNKSYIFELFKRESLYIIYLNILLWLRTLKNAEVKDKEYAKSLKTLISITYFSEMCFPENYVWFNENVAALHTKVWN